MLRKQVVHMLFWFIIFIMLWAAFAVSAVKFGSDSRDGDDWYYHRPA